jgi:hypothetical protein
MFLRNRGHVILIHSPNKVRQARIGTIIRSKNKIGMYVQFMVSSVEIELDASVNIPIVLTTIVYIVEELRK